MSYIVNQGYQSEERIDAAHFRVDAADGFIYFLSQGQDVVLFAIDKSLVQTITKVADPS